MLFKKKKLKQTKNKPADKVFVWSFCISAFAKSEPERPQYIIYFIIHGNKHLLWGQENK